MKSCYRTLVIVLVMVAQRFEAYEVATSYLTACAGKTFGGGQAQCPSGSIINMRSLTLYATTNTAALGDRGLSNCIDVSQCQRVIHNADDFGLSTTYEHLYRWFQNLCEGKGECDGGTLPPWWQLTGEIKDNASPTKSCPATGTKYFTGVFIHFDCLKGEVVPTVPPPPQTTPLTRATTPTSTTPFPVFIPLYLPLMQPIEKIILGVVIGLSIVILIVLLIILYCCQRYQDHKKFKKLLRMLGAPKAQDDYDDYDDYSKTEAWTDGVINPDALGEYTGVKPDEFLSMTEENLMMTGQIMPDSMCGTMTGGGRRNSCSTLSRNTGSPGRYPSGVLNGSYVGDLDYNTEENLELEKRMAAVLDDSDSDDDEVGSGKLNISVASATSSTSYQNSPTSPDKHYLNTEPQHNQTDNGDENQVNIQTPTVEDNQNAKPVTTIDQLDEPVTAIDGMEFDSIMNAVLEVAESSSSVSSTHGGDNYEEASTASLSSTVDNNESSVI